MSSGIPSQFSLYSLTPNATNSPAQLRTGALNVYRLYNQKSNTHYYSSLLATAEAIQTQLADFKLEGIAFGAATGADASSVYSFFDTTSNSVFYTAEVAERDNILKNMPSFIYQGADFKAYKKSSSSAGIDVHRFLNPHTGEHLFISDPKEYEQILANQPYFLYEGVAFKTDAASNVPSNTLASTAYPTLISNSLLFYNAERSGQLVNNSGYFGNTLYPNNVSWRGNSALTDGSLANGIYFGGDYTTSSPQAGLTTDLVGGYHDAGDHVKFGLPFAESLTTLAWGGIEFAAGYSASSQTTALYQAVKWGTDYLLKCEKLGTDLSGYFVAQVGDGNLDHSYWGPSEKQTFQRPAYAVTKDKPGSDVAGSSAAALAAASILFTSTDSSYSSTLLASAKRLYQFAKTYQGKYSDVIPDAQEFYPSYSYQDELALSAAWLYKATGESSYLNDAKTFYSGIQYSLGWGSTMNWDTSIYSAALLLSQAGLGSEPLGGNSPTLDANIKGWLDSWVNGANGINITTGGLRVIGGGQWGNLRYSANTAMLAGMYSNWTAITDPTRSANYESLAQSQIDYITGLNPDGFSYVTGYGNNFPLAPHHEDASGYTDWTGFNTAAGNGSQTSPPNTHAYDFLGALVGGPATNSDSSYIDNIGNSNTNEVALDYNAGFTGALAWAAK